MDIYKKILKCFGGFEHADAVALANRVLDAVLVEMGDCAYDEATLDATIRKAVGAVVMRGMRCEPH